MNIQPFSEIAQQCESIAKEIQSGNFHDIIQRINEGVRIIERSHSRSWIGYQSYVYYRNFNEPPPRDHFNSEWGLEPSYSNPTSNNWLEVSFEAVESAIYSAAGNPNLETLENRSKEVKAVFNKIKPQLLGLLDSALDVSRSEVIEELREKLKKLPDSYSQEDMMSTEMPRGQFMTRDTLAMSQGVRPPPHVVISSHLISVGSAFFQIGELGNIAETAANYLRQKFAQAKTGGILMDGKIFVGHGRSNDWRLLTAFIGERLRLKWDEFNRESTAGLSIKERLDAMLDQANFAFLIMTAEDEHADNSLHARENVIHEIGLFQGRLGFNRAIILLEEGCTEFSNVHGIGQIRYPRGYISAAYEEIRRVLERESILSSSQ